MAKSWDNSSKSIDWSEFVKTENESINTCGNKPNVFRYMLIKGTDNALIIIVCMLLIFFTVSSFYFNSEENKLSTWLLHSAELCLGVILGLFANKKR